MTAAFYQQILYQMESVELCNSFGMDYMRTLNVSRNHLTGKKNSAFLCPKFKSLVCHRWQQWEKDL